MSASPVATATADPLDDPPGTRAGSIGLTGVPNAVLIPLMPYASSWRLTLPARHAWPRAIAARRPVMHTASAAAGLARSATARLPAVVGRPATSMRSLTATRSPGPGVASFKIHVDITDQCGRGRRTHRPKARRRRGAPAVRRGG